MHAPIERLTDLTLTTDLSAPQSNSLGTKFSELMTRAPLAMPQHIESDGVGVVRQMAIHQAQSFDQAVSSMEAALQVDGKSMSELTQTSIRLMVQLTSLNCDIQLKTSLVDSSKQAAETLMKNQ